jgi:DNA repair exonuclease SbcCD ATPase subunit
MKLLFNRIELHNFKGIVGTLRFNFYDQPGFYFIQGINKKEPRLGANGVGKSTIFLDGPYWVLTGKTILSQRPGALVENWNDNKNVSGKLNLTLAGIEYVIERGRNPSVLTLNGTIVQQSEIDNLLPLSDAALRRTLLLGQRSSLFLDLRPEDKSRLFSETLDLDRWLVAADKAGEKIREQDRKAMMLRQDIARYAGIIDQIRDQHEAAAKQEEEFEDAKALKIADISAQLEKQSELVNTTRTSLQDARQALSSLPKDSTDKLKQLRDDENQARRSLSVAESELRIVRREEQQVKDKIVAYRDFTCPECGQTIDNPTNKISELQAQAKELAKRGDEHAASANGLSETLATITRRIEDLQKFETQDIEIKSEINMLDRVLTNEVRVHFRMNQELAAIMNEENQFTALCNDLEETYEATKAKHATIVLEEETINHEIEIYRFWQKGFRDIRLELIDSTLLELELATNRNAQALGLEDWRIAFSTERETKSGSVSQAFTVLLYPPGQASPIDWAAFSGGEAQRWHLAVTCGLSEVLLRRAGIEPDTEIYDEVTSYISSEGIENVLDFLRQRALDLDRKIYLIDHHVGVGDFTNVIQVVKDDTGIHLSI